MKRITALLLVAVICLSLVACGKSEAVKSAEDAIAAIGEVSINSGDLIASAEKLYNILTDTEKAKVENRLALVEAQETFVEVRAAASYENAKQAYEKLKEVASLCVNGMDSIYGAWYFGIYEADDANYSFFFTAMSFEVPGLSSEELEAAAKELGFSAYSAMASWQVCLWITEKAIEMRGDYDTISANMTDAEKTLQLLTDEYEDYTYYPKLKEYYASIASYVEFYKNPTGSFKQLADTINNYENGIRTLETDVGFLFSK